MNNFEPMEWHILDMYRLPEEVEKYNNIYIYGAGMVGTAVYEYLTSRKLCNKVNSFIESFVVEEKKHISGKQIVDVHNLIISEGDLVILAAQKVIRKELKEVCDILGIQNYVEINCFDERDYDYYASLPTELYPIELKYWYKRITGEELDLDNPQTFNEKINWMKIYDKDDRKTILADKYLVRQYVKEKIGDEYLTKILGVWKNFDEINFNNLPEKFVLKCNHGCGWNIIVQDKSKFNYNSARKNINQWLKTNYAFVYGFENHYKNITPLIIAEEYIENDNNDLYDYKFWCYNGKVEFIMFLSNRKNSLLMDNYDINWELLPFTYDYPNSNIDREKPSNLKEMIELAEVLAEGFSFVRVDFYRLNDGKIKFGEMTFTPASGTCRWNEKDINNKLGKLISLDKGTPKNECR